MQTYFGKPPFEAYGYGNTTSVDGCTFYGNHMKTFNLNPHKGANRPRYKQVHPHAELFSQLYPVKAAVLPRHLSEAPLEVTIPVIS